MAEKIEKFIAEIEALTVLELNDLVKAIEEKFGVSAAAPVMMVGGPVAAAEEEKTEFDAVLTEVGPDKMSVIRAVKEITGLGIIESKNLVSEVPKAIKEAISKTDAEEIQKKLEALGAKVELK